MSRASSCPSPVFACALPTPGSLPTPRPCGRAHGQTGLRCPVEEERWSDCCCGVACKATRGEGSLIIVASVVGDWTPPSAPPPPGSPSPSTRFKGIAELAGEGAVCGGDTLEVRIVWPTVAVV